jgi:hypothetical protein
MPSIPIVVIAETPGFLPRFPNPSHDLLSTQQQPVDMVGLRNGLMERGLVVDVVPFEDGDRVEVIGEHPRRHQSREAPADDNCVLTKVRDHKPSLLIVESPQETPN